MTFWHGTTIENARKIAKEGLKPIPEKKYELEDIGLFGGTLRELEGKQAERYIYLTEHQERAKLYADFRTRYERLAPGETIEQFGGWSLVKNGGRKTNAKAAAIIRVELPKEYASKLEPDPQDWQDAYHFAGAIPPEFIREVIRL